MNEDLARLCRAAQRTQAADPARGISMEDIVRAIITEMLEPADGVANFIDDYIQYCDDHGKFVRDIVPEDGQIAAAAFVGGCRSFLREE